MNGNVIVKVFEEIGVQNEPSDKILGLSASFFYFSTEHTTKYVKLTWNFSNAVNLIDWIGMFQVDQHNPLLYMDYKNYGVCGLKNGSVDWKINGSLLPINYKNYYVSSNSPTKLDANNNNDSTKLCFKYYDGLTGALRAISPPLLVYSDAQISVKSIICKQLTKAKNVLYYARVSYSGTETCNYRTIYSNNACWTNLNFLFPVDCSAELKFLIKEKHWSGDRTLGLVNIPIIDLTEKTNQNLAFILRPTTTSTISQFYNKNNSKCQIFVSCSLIPKHQQSYIDTMNTLLTQSNTALNNNLLLNFKKEKKNLENNNYMENKEIKQSLHISTTLNSLNSYSLTSKTMSICSTSPSCSSTSQQNNVDQINLTQNSKKLNLFNQPIFNANNTNSNLPPGWEARVDRHGHLLYLDHINKRTTWYPPVILESKIEQNDKKYICARRTVIDNSDTEQNFSDDSKYLKSKKLYKNVNKQSAQTSFATNSSTEKPKGLTFLQRSDFLNLLQTNSKALQMYNESVYLKHIIYRIRKEPVKFTKFKNNRELVEFLNLFADKTQPLPSNWQMAHSSGNFEEVFFINHKSKQITVIDPRLPDEVTSRRRVQSAPPSRKNLINKKNISNGNTILNIISRTNELQKIVKERFPEIAPKVCQKLKLIEKMGEVALYKFANDIDLITAISVLDQCDTKPKNEFEEKLIYFYNSLQKAGYGRGPNKIHFRLRRSHLMNDAFDKILAIDSTKLKRSQMSVTFDEEDGLDYGGPSRELFFLLSRELFNPYYGLFEYSANDTYTVQISPISKFVDNYLEWMELCGRVIGLALIHRCMIDTFFSTAFYKFLLKIPYKLEDLKSMDYQFYKSLLWIRENKITPELDLTFSTTEEVGGEIIEKELLPDGKNLLVDEFNKENYISLILKWRMERSVEQQSQVFLRGLYSIIDSNYLQIFDEKQLELVLSGTIEIKIEDWRENTEYKGGYFDGHVVINWFWQTVYSFCNADRLKLLQFVTGTSSVPYEGFKALRGSNGLKKFTIEKYGNEDSLPRAHTCFNRLDLPSYETQKILQTKLKMAIYESSCYAME